MTLLRYLSPWALWALSTAAVAQTCPAGNPRVAPDSRYSIDSMWVPNTPSNFYWTGHNSAPNASAAWIINFSDGFLNTGLKLNSLRVRLVRGGQ